MAMVVRKSLAAQLLEKSLERQVAIAHAKLKIKPKQVENAVVAQVEHNNVMQYNELIKILREYPLNDNNFKCVVDDCLSCVVLLGRNLVPFVNVVLSLDWVHRDDTLVNLYSTFLIGLVTAHTYHCPSVMKSLVKLFQAKGDDWEENGPSPKQVQSWSHIHSTIAKIVAIMPMTSDLLMQITIESFPYYKAGCYANRSYVHNLIWMSKYLPSLREQLMMAIINRMIVLDVNVVERDKNNKADTPFVIESEDPDEVAQSLDCCMLEVLNWLQDERDPILLILCNVFERVVLPTYGIRHVQFLLLYTISINQQCADRVLNNLWTVAAGLQGLGPGALATRRTAASHLSGLLARCVRIPNSRLIHYLKSMTEWCHAYITATQDTSATDNLKAHGAFHAVCHAVFYLIAFKHHHLFNSKESLLFIESLNLPRLVTCALNPLRACPPAVTRAFSSVTRAHQVAYCQAVVERNQRHTLQHAESLQYDEWFPYDPYTLPRSGKIIWPLCIEYKNWGKDADSTQYAGMKRKLEEDDDFLTSTSPSQRIASLCNGVSPGFRTSESIHMN